MPTHARHSDSIITSRAAEKAMELRHVQAHPHGRYPAGNKKKTILPKGESCGHMFKTSGGGKRSIKQSQIAPDIEHMTATLSVHASCIEHRSLLSNS